MASSCSVSRFVHLHVSYDGRMILLGTKMLYQGDDSAIEEFLKGQLDEARAEYDTAYKKFDLLIKDIPSEIPQPDGSLRIRQAGGASRAALQNYKRALKRFTEYAFSGTVPKDLLPPD
jgi:hypothetical protein